MANPYRALAELDDEQLARVQQFIEQGCELPDMPEHVLGFNSEEECDRAEAILSMFNNGDKQPLPPDAVQRILDQSKTYEKMRDAVQAQTRREQPTTPPKATVTHIQPPGSEQQPKHSKRRGSRFRAWAAGQ